MKDSARHSDQAEDGYVEPSKGRTGYEALPSEKCHADGIPGTYRQYLAHSSRAYHKCYIWLFTLSDAPNGGAPFTGSSLFMATPLQWLKAGLLHASLRFEESLCPKASPPCPPHVTYLSYPIGIYARDSAQAVSFPRGSALLACSARRIHRGSRTRQRTNDAHPDFPHFGLRCEIE